VLGLAQNAASFLNPETPVGPLLIDYLANQGEIQSPTFSFALDGLSFEYSSINFDDPWDVAMKDGATTRIFGVNDDFFWSVYL
jgi:hypothetical protein